MILVDTMFYAAIVPLLPEYATTSGSRSPAPGILSASYAAGTLLAALPSGWLAAKIGFGQTMLAGLALLSVSSLVFAFADSVVAARRRRVSPRASAAPAPGPAASRG